MFLRGGAGGGGDTPLHTMLTKNFFVQYLWKQDIFRDQNILYSPDDKSNYWRRL